MKYQHTALYINGSWDEPTGGESIAVISPTTEQQIGVVPRAANADVDKAVAAAGRVESRIVV